MKITLSDILKFVGVDPYELDEEVQAFMDEEIEVHYQPNYPLKAKIIAVNLLDGKLVLALDEAESYGDKEAWTC